MALFLRLSSWLSAGVSSGISLGLRIETQAQRGHHALVWIGYLEVAYEVIAAAAKRIVCGGVAVARV